MIDLCAIPIEGFKLTQSSKVSLIQRLIVAVEQRRVSWPAGERGLTTKNRKNTERENGGEREGEGLAQRRGGAEGGDDWDVLTNEMKRYEYAISPSGGISYGAPAGYHDDCVIALALANYRRWETENCGRMMVVGARGGAGAGGGADGLMGGDASRNWGMRVRKRGRVLLG